MLESYNTLGSKTSWRSVRNVVRSAKDAVINKSSVLQKPVAKLIRNAALFPEGPQTSTQPVPISEIEPVSSPKQQSQALPTQSLFACCVLVLLSFLLGCWWGARQQRSHHAMLQAKAADQHTGELAQISLPASTSSVSAHPSHSSIGVAAPISDHGAALAQERQAREAPVASAPDQHSLSQQGDATTDQETSKGLGDTQAPETIPWEAAEQPQAPADVSTGRSDSQHQETDPAEQSQESSQTGISSNQDLTMNRTEPNQVANELGRASKQNDANESASSQASQAADATEPMVLPLPAEAQTWDDPIRAAAGTPSLTPFVQPFTCKLRYTIWHILLIPTSIVIHMSLSPTPYS